MEKIRLEKSKTRERYQNAHPRFNSSYGNFYLNGKRDVQIMPMLLVLEESNTETETIPESTRERHKSIYSLKFGKEILKLLELQNKPSQLNLSQSEHAFGSFTEDESLYLSG